LPDKEMVSTITPRLILHYLGKKQFEMTDHLGNVNSTISDRKIPVESTITPGTISYKIADILSTSGFYPFGMMIKSREFVEFDSYRMGFNSQEKDDEISGEGNSYAFESRCFDSRLSRFLSLDPLSSNFPGNSPFAFAENTPIRFIELEGKEIAEPELFILAEAMLGQLESETSSSGINSTLFSGLTRTEVIQQLRSKLQNPSSVGAINSGGWFCGTAADMVVASNYNPLAYISTVWDLVTTGQVNVMGGNVTTIIVPDWVKTEAQTSGIVSVDEIVRNSLRASENINSDDNFMQSGSSVKQGTPPWEQDNQMSRLGLGVKSKSYYTGQSNRDLNRMEKAIKSGYLPIVFENHKISGGGKESGAMGLLGVHYIVIKKFEQNIKDKTVTITYISYGKEETKTVSKKDFKKGMKGYWIPKNEKNAGGSEKKTN